MMRIAVYAIAKDEAHNASTWARCTREADAVIVLDTGSSDGTPKALRTHGVDVHERRIEPWRFDDARNAALALVPEDVDMCLCLDLDERIEPGWREEVDRLWNRGARWISYRYIWQWADDEDTVPAITIYKSCLHARHDFHWVGLVHEKLKSDTVSTEDIVHSEQIVIGHHGKIFHDYTEFLTRVIAEEPGNADARIQRGADHIAMESWAQAEADYLAYLDMTRKESGTDVRAKRSRAWICVAQARRRLNRTGVLEALLSAVAEHSGSREAWTYLADWWRALGNWPAAYGAAMNALSITESGLEARDELCWGDYPRDIACAARVRITGGGNGAGVIRRQTQGW